MKRGDADQPGDLRMEMRGQVRSVRSIGYETASLRCGAVLCGSLPSLGQAEVRSGSYPFPTLQSPSVSRSVAVSPLGIRAPEEVGRLHACYICTLLITGLRVVGVLSLLPALLYGEAAVHRQVSALPVSALSERLEQAPRICVRSDPVGHDSGDSPRPLAHSHWMEKRPERENGPATTPPLLHY